MGNIFQRLVRETWLRLLVQANIPTLQNNGFKSKIKLEFKGLFLLLSFLPSFNSLKAKLEGVREKQMESDIKKFVG